MDSWKLGMGAVAERLIAGMLTTAEEDRLGLRRVIFDGRKFAALVRTVAEGLVFAAPAATPPVAFARRYLESVWRSLRDRGFGHEISPKTAQFSRAQSVKQSLADGPSPTQGRCAKPRPKPSGPHAEIAVAG